MLTIGQLAKHCGVTVRAVRHYHRIGLLPEPGRDASGYRRYGAKAVVSLFRIKVLAEAGVPLVRVGQLLEAGPADFAAAVADVDLALRGQIAQLEQRRRQLAGLAAGDRLFVSGEVADLLDQLAAVGASERAIAVEKDGWTLIEALAPELASYLAKRKRAALSDPEFCRLYLACDHAWDLRPWGRRARRARRLDRRVVDQTCRSCARSSPWLVSSPHHLGPPAIGRRALELVTSLAAPSGAGKRRFSRLSLHRPPGPARNARATRRRKDPVASTN
jgi:DNA-binding transcriptional MerR regulator